MVRRCSTRHYPQRGRLKCGPLHRGFGSTRGASVDPCRGLNRRLEGGGGPHFKIMYHRELLSDLLILLGKISKCLSICVDHLSCTDFTILIGMAALRRRAAMQSRFLHRGWPRRVRGGSA
jgi:hypothetical protein